MVKQLYKHSMQFERDHPSCMGGLVSLFDFRTGPPILRLISDARHRSSRHAVDDGYPRTGRKLLTNGSQKRRETAASTSNFSGYKESKTNKVGSDKTSVKALMDEEMSRLQPSRKQIIKATNKKMGPNSRHLRVKGRQTTKTRSMVSNQFPNNQGTSTRLDSHRSNQPELKGRFLVVEEPSRRKRHISEMHPNLKNKLNSCQTQISSSQKHDPHHKPHIKVPRKHVIMKNGPTEDTESFLNQKFLSAKQHTKDGALHRSKECMDALKILNSNKELFLKLLEDPNSLLMKHIQDLRNAQLEKLSKKEDNSSSMQNDEIFDHKQNGRQNIPRFFGRKDEASQLEHTKKPSRIVILKPKNSTTIQSSMTISTSVPSSQSHYVLNNQANSERFASNFSIREFTRKLKHVVIESKKKRTSVLTDETQRISNGPQDPRDTTTKSSITQVSYEPSIGFDRREIKRVLDGHWSSAGHEDNRNTAAYPHQRECNIYEAAKKHLAEMPNTGYGGGDLQSGQLPRMLDRTLTTSEGKHLPSASSQEDEKEPSFASSSHDGQSKSEDLSFYKKGESINCSSSSIQNVENLLLSADSNQEVEVQETVSSLELRKENVHASKMKESICNGGTLSPKGVMEMIEMVDDLCMEEGSMVGSPSELEMRTSIAESMHSNDVTDTVEHDESFEILAQESFKETTLSTSPLVPFPGKHLLIHEREALETMSEKVERPSPVSVLEPLFTEDVISPANPQDDNLTMEARVIHFDECDNLASGTVVPKVKQKDYVEQQKSKFEFVKIVLEASGLHLKETIEWQHFPRQLLNPLKFNEIEGSSAQSSEEWRLLFDCINEVLNEVYEQFFEFCPWVSFGRPSLRRLPVGKDVVQEVLKGVEQHLKPQFQNTLDEIIGKDMEKCRTWMDLRIDAKHISMEMEEIILEDLIDEAILDYWN